MDPLRRIAAALCALAVSPAAVGPALAQDARPVEIRIASTAPQKSVWGMQLDRGASLVAEESKGTIRFQNYFGGQLGTEPEIVQQVARGRLDGGAVPLGTLALLVPELQVLGLPMYFRDGAELDCVLDGPLGADIAGRLARRNVRLLGFGEVGALHLVGKRPFAAPGELAGLKAGSYGTRLGTILWQGLGAHVAPTSGPELASAFQTGLIDVALTVPTFYVAAGVNKPAPTITLVALAPGPSATVMHQPLWDRLPAEQQAALGRALARQPAAMLRGEVREFEGRMLAAHEQGGGRIVRPTSEQREAFRAAVAPLWPRMVAEAGPDAPAFFERVEAARTSCAGK